MGKAVMGHGGEEVGTAVMGRGGGEVGTAATRPGINPRADATKPLRGWGRSPGPCPLGSWGAVVAAGQPHEHAATGGVLDLPEIAPVDQRRGGRPVMGSPLERVARKAEMIPNLALGSGDWVGGSEPD